MEGWALWETVKRTLQEWWDDKVPRMAAALAYYALFSLGPLLLLVIAIAGLAFGAEAVQGRVGAQFEALAGPEGAAMVESMVAGASDRDAGLFAAVAGGALLLFGAVSVLVQLQDALNTIWGAEPPKRRFLQKVKARLRAFALVLGLGFLLTLSLVASAALAVLTDAGDSLLPGSEEAWFALELALSVLALTVLFAATFRVLPEVDIPWRDVWVGSFVTAAMFAAGKAAIGLYLGRADVGGAFGAAGALVLILVWVYYCSQIVLLGAEFTQVWAARRAEREGAQAGGAGGAWPMAPKAPSAPPRPLP